MAITLQVLLLITSSYLTLGQRPSYAGFRPIGYPELQNKTTPVTDVFGNRFGDDGQQLPLPIEAQGDRDLVDRISRLPLDKQPFWYINWKALEEQRRNPQTYGQRPSPFLPNQPASPNNNGSNNSGVTDLSSRFGTNNIGNTTQVNQTVVQNQTVYRPTRGQRRSFFYY